MRQKRFFLLLLRIQLYGLGPLYALWKYVNDVRTYGETAKLPPISQPVRHELADLAVITILVWAVAVAADISLTWLTWDD